jgi:hypothetical protein
LHFFLLTLPSLISFIIIQTQEMVKKAQEDFPNLEWNDAVQKEADMGPGREAKQGEGQPTSAVEEIKETAKHAAESLVDTLKEANPATRDFKEPHC